MKKKAGDPPEWFSSVVKAMKMDAPRSVQPDWDEVARELAKGFEIEQKK